MKLLSFPDLLEQFVFLPFYKMVKSKKKSIEIQLIRIRRSEHIGSVVTESEGKKFRLYALFAPRYVFMLSRDQVKCMLH